MTTQQILTLLRTGDFTIVYWDNGYATLYKGKWDIHKEYMKDDYKTMNKSVVAEFDGSLGYCPDIVHLLATALRGKTDSI